MVRIFIIEFLWIKLQNKVYIKKQISNNIARAVAHSNTRCLRKVANFTFDVTYGSPGCSPAAMSDLSCPQF